MPLGLDIADILGSPIWQGTGVLVALISLMIPIFVHRRGRVPGIGNAQSVAGAPSKLASAASNSIVYNLTTTDEEQRYYRALAESIRGAYSAIYRSGRGFSSAQKEEHIRELIAAESEALEKGIDIVRVQTSDRATPLWAELYADLLDKYPDRLRVYADFGDPALVNVGLIDPGGPSPTIQILFESVDVAQRRRIIADAALVMTGPPRFALSLQAQFEEWIGTLQIMTSHQIRDLAKTYLYFAYGSNMLAEQMRERCPRAIRMGAGVLYGWKRNFAVQAKHFGEHASAAGIEPSEDDSQYIEGVVYKVSPNEKEVIDGIEKGGYAPKEVAFKLSGKHVTGFTHVPIALSAGTDLTLPKEYVEIMIRGAKQNGLNQLADELSQFA